MTIKFAADLALVLENLVHVVLSFPLHLQMNLKPEATSELVNLCLESSYFTLATKAPR